MNLLKTLWVVSLVFVVGCSSKTPEEALDAAIVEMTSLLEQGKTQEFLEDYYDRDINAMWERGGGMKAWARQYDDKYTAHTLASLKTALTMTPDMNENQVIALYSSNQGTVPLGFYNNGGWRLMDSKSVWKVINSAQ